MNALKKTLAVLGLAVLGAGATASVAGGNGPDGSETASTAAKASAASHVRQARLAVRTATRAVRRGRAFDLERDRHRGRPVWEVKVDSRQARPIEVLVGGSGRGVIRRHRTNRSDGVRKVRRAKVGLRRALRISGRYGRGALADAGIDRHRGQLVWEVTFRQGRAETEVRINARTGRLDGVTHETAD